MAWDTSSKHNTATISDNQHIIMYGLRHIIKTQHCNYFGQSTHNHVWLGTLYQNTTLKIFRTICLLPAANREMDIWHQNDENGHWPPTPITTTKNGQQPLLPPPGKMTSEIDELNYYLARSMAAVIFVFLLALDDVEVSRTVFVCGFLFFSENQQYFLHGPAASVPPHYFAVDWCHRWALLGLCIKPMVLSFCFINSTAVAEYSVWTFGCDDVLTTTH